MTENETAVLSALEDSSWDMVPRLSDTHTVLTPIITIFSLQSQSRLAVIRKILVVSITEYWR